MRITNEPTAAAIAYGLQENPIGEEKVLILDLGAGKLDVSIVNIKCNRYKVLSTAGDTHLGGEDIDNCLVNHFAQECKNKEDLQLDVRALCRLRTSCQAAKKISSSYEANIKVSYKGVDFCTQITRAHFENLNNEFFEATLKTVRKAIDVAKIHKSEIDGGSSRIPKVRQLLQNHFKTKEFYEKINPHEAVVIGIIDKYYNSN